MLNEGDIVVVSTIINLLAAVAGICAAVAAVRYARSASVAVQHAQEIEKSSLFKDLNTKAQTLISELQRVEDLSKELKDAYEYLFTLAGQFQSSLKDRKINEVERRNQEIQLLKDDAVKFLNDEEIIEHYPEEEFSKLQNKLAGHLIETSRVKEALYHEISIVKDEKNNLHEK